MQPQMIANNNRNHYHHRDPHPYPQYHPENPSERASDQLESATNLAITNNYLAALQRNLSYKKEIKKMATQLRESTHKRRVVVVVTKPKGVLNPALISLVLITFVISSQSIATFMSAGRSLRPTESTAGSGTSQDSGPANAIHLRANEKVVGSLIGLVSAEPAPEPSPAATRSAGSSSHRIPPMNGSIFGKRSVDGNRYGQRQQRQQQKASGSDSQQRQQQQQQEQEEQYQTVDGIAGEQQRVQRLPWIRSIAAPNNQAADYKAIITETIEDFLALNNESNPEQASVAFCRMIVYECSQLLSTKSRGHKWSRGRGGLAQRRTIAAN